VNNPHAGVREYGLEGSGDDFELGDAEAVNGNPFDEDAIVGEVVPHLPVKFLSIEDPTVAGFWVCGVGDNDGPLSGGGHNEVSAVVNDDAGLWVLEEAVIFLREKGGGPNDAFFEVHYCEGFHFGQN
jgi:hypothetical protein